MTQGAARPSDWGSPSSGLWTGPPDPQPTMLDGFVGDRVDSTAGGRERRRIERPKDWGGRAAVYRAAAYREARGLGRESGGVSGVRAV